VKQVSFRHGNVNELPFDNDTFDWAWSVDCVGHPTVGEPLIALQELARVVRPGGQVAILGYSTQVLLPGYPLLEARLNATVSAVTHLAKGRRPESHFLRALGWFREVGLAETAARTVVGTVYAPLGDGIRRALISLFGMLWGICSPRCPRRIGRSTDAWLTLSHRTTSWILRTTMPSSPTRCSRAGSSSCLSSAGRGDSIGASRVLFVRRCQTS